MTDDHDEPREGGSGKDGDEEVDPSDWLSEQFGIDDEQPLPEPKSAFERPSVPGGPPAAPSAFNWGLKPADGASDADPVEPPLLPSVPDGPPRSSTEAPAEPPAPDPFGALIASGVPSSPADPPEPPLPFLPAPVPDQPEQPPTVAMSVEQPATELLNAGDLEAGRPETASTIHSLFGEKQFKDYEDEPLIGAIPFRTEKSADAPTPTPRTPNAPLSRNQKVLLWIAAGAVAILALVVLFLLGTKLPLLLGPSPAVATSQTPRPTPSVVPSAPAVGPVAVGVHKWNTLLGGECIDPFPSVWAETFTVVDCASPHPAQMVFRGTFPAVAPAPGATTAPGTTPAPSGTAAPGVYPGIPALQAQINLLCTAPGVIDLATAGAYSDIQFQAAYPVTEKEWASGYHDYFCFVSRSSGGPIAGSLAHLAG